MTCDRTLFRETIRVLTDAAAGLAIRLAASSGLWCKGCQLTYRR